MHPFPRLVLHPISSGSRRTLHSSLKEAFSIRSGVPLDMVQEMFLQNGRGDSKHMTERMNAEEVDRLDVVAIAPHPDDLELCCRDARETRQARISRWNF